MLDVPASPVIKSPAVQTREQSVVPTVAWQLAVTIMLLLVIAAIFHWFIRSLDELGLTAFIAGLTLISVVFVLYTYIRGVFGHPYS